MCVHIADCPVLVTESRGLSGHKGRSNEKQFLIVSVIASVQIVLDC